MKFPSPEFDNAVALLCHGTITNEASAELHELLRTDAEARDEYLWRVEVHGELASGRLDFGHASNFEPDGFGWESTATLVPDASSKRRRSYPAPPVVVAMLALVTVCGGLWMWHESQTASVETGLPAKALAVATIAELHDCRWMDPAAEVSSGDAVRVAQRIELSSGIAEVLFNTGARLKIVGPTIFEPRTDNSVFLTLGEVHLDAGTPESKGFTVVTPTSKFVDISTAFTARVSPDGLSRLKVSEGEVDVVLEGVERSPRLRAGETLYVEPGERQVMTRIEEGDGTDAFHFPTIQSPSHEDLADQALGHASVRVVRGQLNFKPGRGTSGPPDVLIDGAGQSHQDAPGESAFFQDHTSGGLLMDLGSVVAISRINSYSWHQHETNESHRHRARQRFTLYGYSGDQLPDLTRPPRESGWTRIARVNSDRFFEVTTPLDRPAQQASSITAAQGEIGQFRYLLWEVSGNTFFGELDVFGSPHATQETP